MSLNTQYFYSIGGYPYIISCKEQYVCGVSTVSLNTSTGLGLTWKSNTQVFWVTTNTHRSGLGWVGMVGGGYRHMSLNTHRSQVWAGNESAQGCDSKKNFTGDRNTKLFWWWHKRKTLNSQNMFFSFKRNLNRKQLCKRWQCRNSQQYLQHWWLNSKTASKQAEPRKGC